LVGRQSREDLDPLQAMAAPILMRGHEAMR
jgi:hypothetical protein